MLDSCPAPESLAGKKAGPVGGRFSSQGFLVRECELRFRLAFSLSRIPSTHVQGRRDYCSLKDQAWERGNLLLLHPRARGLGRL